MTMASVTHAAAAPQVSVFLLAAGAVPEMLDLSHLLGGLQLVYFALLIPVAAGHLVSWIREHLIKKRE